LDVSVRSFRILESAPSASSAFLVLVDPNVEVPALGVGKRGERASELGREDLKRLEVGEVILLNGQDGGDLRWLDVDDFDGDDRSLALASGGSPQ
jgi:hypothetical protein